VNHAAELGPRMFPWWPDWRGQPAAIIASGPSTGKFPVEQLRGACKVLAIKTNVDKAPWADVVYGCDDAWWISRNGLVDFSGAKLAYGSKATSKYPDIYKVDIDTKQDRFLLDKPLRIGSGKNSGFQALNLAMQFGANPILLIGYDFKEVGGKLHWYGRNNGHGMSNPMLHNFRNWTDAMNAAAGQAKALGFDIINASDSSELKCFRRGGLRDIGLTA
jgi:hypothetical protein